MADKPTESLVFRLKAFTIPSESIELDEGTTLGHGSYGRVFRGVYRKQDVAVKTLHKVFFEIGDVANQKAVIRSLLVECELLSRLQHLNIVQLHGVVYPGTAGMLMVTELMDVSLAERYSSSPVLTLCDEVDIAHDVVYALVYLHGFSPHSIMHRDLAPKNILLKEDAASALVAKLADVGLAKVLQSSQLDRVEATVCPGTQSYMPPEALVSRGALYGTSLDIYSFGMTVIELVLRKPATVLERQRKADLDEVRQRSHPLYNVAADSVRDEADERPTAVKLQSRLKDMRSEKHYVVSSKRREAARKRSKANKSKEWRNEYFKLLEEGEIETVELKGGKEVLTKQLEVQCERTGLTCQRINTLQKDFNRQLSLESSSNASQWTIQSRYTGEHGPNHQQSPSACNGFSTVSTRDMSHMDSESTRPIYTSGDVALPVSRVDSIIAKQPTSNGHDNVLPHVGSTLARPPTHNSYNDHWRHANSAEVRQAAFNSHDVLLASHMDSTIAWPPTQDSHDIQPRVDLTAGRPMCNSHGIPQAPHVASTMTTPVYTSDKDILHVSSTTTTRSAYNPHNGTLPEPHVDSTTRPTYSAHGIQAEQCVDSTTGRQMYSSDSASQPTHHSLAIWDKTAYASYNSEPGEGTAAVIGAQAPYSHTTGRSLHYATYGREPMRSILNPKPSWEKLPELPVTAVQESSSAFWNGDLYVVVPCNGKAILRGGNDLLLLRLKSDSSTWEQMNVPSPAGVAWPSALHVDVRRNRLYVTIVDVHFETGEPDSLWVLNESTCRWQFMRHLSFARRATALHGDLFIAAGGCSALSQRFTESKRQVDVINLQTNTEARWQPMPSGYYEGRLIPFGEELLCLGGHENTCISAIDTRKPTIWRTHDSSPLPAYLCGTTAFEKSLYCVGGLASSSHSSPEATPTVRQWTAQKGWQVLPSIPQPCIVPSMAVHNRSLFCVGGQTADLMLSMNSVHRLPLESWT